MSIFFQVFLLAWNNQTIFLFVFKNVWFWWNNSYRYGALYLLIKIILLCQFQSYNFLYFLNFLSDLKQWICHSHYQHSSFSIWSSIHHIHNCIDTCPRRVHCNHIWLTCYVPYKVGIVPVANNYPRDSLQCQILQWAFKCVVHWLLVVLVLLSQVIMYQSYLGHIDWSMKSIIF